MDKKKTLVAAAGTVVGIAAGRAIDLALIAASVATATGAVGFAGYMMLTGDHKTHVNGMEYLAIFAQPSHPQRGEDSGPKLDMNPVGAIPPDSKVRVGGYQLVGAQERSAWLRDGNYIFAVHPGEDVPRLGHIAKIEQRDGRWELLDDKGAPLIVSGVADLTPSVGGRFDKKMIFGDP